VGALAAAEPLAGLPPAFPATVRVARKVTEQALVAFRGNSYSVPPGLAGTTVTVVHRLGTATLDVITGAAGIGAGAGPAGSALPTVLARHHREPDGAGVLVRDNRPCHRAGDQGPHAVQH